MDSKVVRTSKIDIEVGLDKDNFPIEIKWQSSDAPAGYPVQEAKAMLDRKSTRLNSSHQ